MSFVLAGAVLRGPGPLPSARSGRGKRWQAQHTRRLCWQARHLVSFVLAGAVLRGPGPLPSARSGRAKRWQARHTRRLCWQARHLEALDPCRARARGARNAGRRDTGVVSAGRRGTQGPWTVAARALGARETLAGATQVSFVLAGAVLRGPGPLPRARSAPTLQVVRRGHPELPWLESRLF